MKKDRFKQIRLTEEQLVLLKKKASLAGQSDTEYILSKLELNGCSDKKKDVVTKTPSKRKNVVTKEKIVRTVSDTVEKDMTGLSIHQIISWKKNPTWDREQVLKGKA